MFQMPESVILLGQKLVERLEVSNDLARKRLEIAKAKEAKRQNDTTGELPKEIELECENCGHTSYHEVE